MTQLDMGKRSLEERSDDEGGQPMVGSTKETENQQSFIETPICLTLL